MRAGSMSRYVAAGVGMTLLMSGWAFGAQAKGPVKVFILAGQSNMDGQAQIRTIDFLGEDPDPAVAGLLKTFKPDGTTFMTRDDVWVGSGDRCFTNLCVGHGGRRGRNLDNWKRLGGHIGPEYAFGYYMGEAFDEQVLLIKYAPGGTSLRSAWRPPSAGPTGDPKADAAEIDQATADKWFMGRTGKVLGCQYRYLVDYVHETLGKLKQYYPAYDEKVGYEIAGFVWFQGFNDLGIGKDEYARLLTCLIKDLRKDLNAPEMKVVVGVLGVNGPRNEGGKQAGVRGGQRAMNAVPEFAGNVKAIETAPLLDARIVALTAGGWLPGYDRDFKANPITPEERAMMGRAMSDKGFHYNGEGRFFILLGKAFADTMLELHGMGAKVVPPKVNHFTPPGK